MGIPDVSGLKGPKGPIGNAGADGKPGNKGVPGHQGDTGMYLLDFWMIPFSCYSLAFKFFNGMLDRTVKLAHQAQLVRKILSDPLVSVIIVLHPEQLLAINSFIIDCVNLVLSKYISHNYQYNKFDSTIIKSWIYFIYSHLNNNGVKNSFLIMITWKIWRKTVFCIAYYSKSPKTTGKIEKRSLKNEDF